MEQLELFDKHGLAFVPPKEQIPGKCDNPRCVCNGQCMMREVERYWGSDAAKQWADGVINDKS